MNRFPGVQTQIHKRKDGSIRIHRYYRPNKTPLFYDPGTPEFAEEYARARAIPVLRKSKSAHKAKRTIRRAAVRPPLFVYFVQCVALRHIKIGRSERPWVRFINIRTACPDEVVLLGAILDPHGRMERDIQARFKHSRIRGEWYAETSSLLALIADAAQPVKPERHRRDAKPLASASRPVTFKRDAERNGKLRVLDLPAPHTEEDER